jgi:hypothetical protein
MVHPLFIEYGYDKCLYPGRTSWFVNGVLSSTKTGKGTGSHRLQRVFDAD